jgi:D-beta-D-heptose 7-phosphate kinase/D-beta-D-heptose 1-phosphate adenosyltransferase
MKIWVNGSFDVLHHAHLKLLSYACSLGDELVVGIDSDDRVRERKGKTRPFHKQSQRKFNLKCINGIKKVHIFHSDAELKKLLKKEKPDIMVIGDEYKNKPIIGKEFVKKIKFFKKIKNFSTTKILNHE